MKNKLNILLITLTVFINSELFTQVCAYPDVWNDAVSLLDKGDTNSALLEIERYRFLNLDNSSCRFLYNLGEFYKLKGDWKEALSWYKEAEKKCSDPVLYSNARYNILYMYTLLKDHYFAGKYMDDILTDSVMIDSLIVNCKIIFLFSLLEQYRWDEALSLSKDIFPDSSEYCDSLFVSNTQFILKSEFKAFNLSYLPGAGQIYSGHFQEGMKSLFLQSVFITGGIFAFNEGLYFISVGLCGSGFLRLYFGGQAYALKMVRFENEKKQNQAYINIKKGLFKLLK